MELLTARRRLGHVLVAGTFLVAGCTAHPATGPVGATALPPDVDTMLFPDAGWVADSVRIRVAEEVLVGDCLADRGHDYPAPPYSLLRPGAAATTPTVLADDDSYGLLADAKAQREVPPPSPRRADAWQRDLYGPAGRQGSLTLPTGIEAQFPTRGCLAAAKRELYGSSLRAARVDTEIGAFRSDVAEEAGAQAPVRQALGAWVDCMRERGVAASSPHHAIDTLRTEYAEHGPTPEMADREAVVAQADADCDRASGYRDTYRTHAAALVAALTGGIGEHLVELAAARRGAERRAAAVLARG
ncbi:hypothetical protein [Nocardioides sp.]|uniref:hypothetical protein n=1 Tax=Nocardioides sp. TaxID=35761 RepID=UPI00356629E2